MSRLISILGLVLMLATMIVLPVKNAYAAVAAASFPTMQMEDGAPCTQQSCANMPNCPMVLPCLSVPLAIAAPFSKPVFQPVIQFVRFAFSTQPTLPFVEGGGVRRPPKT